MKNISTRPKFQTKNCQPTSTSRQYNASTDQNRAYNKAYNLDKKAHNDDDDYLNEVSEALQDLRGTKDLPATGAKELKQVTPHQNKMLVELHRKKIMENVEGEKEYQKYLEECSKSKSI